MVIFISFSIVAFASSFPFLESLKFLLEFAKLFEPEANEFEVDTNESGLLEGLPKPLLDELVNGTGAEKWV